MITTTPWSLRIPQHGDTMAAEILDKCGNVIGFMRDWQQAEQMIKEINPVPIRHGVLGQTRDELYQKIEELEEDLELANKEIYRLDDELKEYKTESST